jgi:hypothetical protein
MAAEDLPRQAHTPEDITDEHFFDELARGLASGTVSRSKMLRLLGGVLVGGVVASIPGLAWAQPNCPSGYTLCGDGKCYDLETNRCNCGACGNVCAGSERGRCCKNGKCTRPKRHATCPEPNDENYCQPGIAPS